MKKKQIEKNETKNEKPKIRKKDKKQESNLNKPLMHQGIAWNLRHLAIESSNPRLSVSDWDCAVVHWRRNGGREE